MQFSEEEQRRMMLEDAESRDIGEFKPVTLPSELENSLNNNMTGSGVNSHENTGGPEVEPEAQAAHLGADEELREIAENKDGKVMFNLSELIDPETAVDLIDWLIPMLAIFIGNKFNIDIDKKEMAFDAKEKKTLAKPLQKAFNETTTGTKNPWIALIIVLVLMIVIKFWSAAMAAKEIAIEEGTEDGEATPYVPKKSTGKGKRGRKPGGKNKAKETTLVAPNVDLLNS